MNLQPTHTSSIRKKSPAKANSLAIGKANLIMTRVDEAREAMEGKGTSQRQGDSVSIKLDDHTTENGFHLGGQMKTDTKTGTVTMKAESTKEGLPKSQLSFEKRGEETVYEDSFLGTVITSPNGTLLMDPTGMGSTKLL